MRGSPFFDGVEQVEATLVGEQAKLPIFYYDGTAQTAIFPAKLSALRKWLPDPRFVPARLAPGLGAIGITCFEYRDTDIGPYNELAITVVLNNPPYASNLPGRAMLAALRSKQMHVWVHHLPVTTEIARVGGVDLYNYPKFVGSIDFEESGSRRLCRLGEAGEPILTLDGPLIATPQSGEVQFFSHLWMDRQPQESEFKINISAGGLERKPGAAKIKLGNNHPIARELAGALVSHNSIHYELMAQFEGILYGPEHLGLQMLPRLLALVETSQLAIH